MGSLSTITGISSALIQPAVSGPETTGPWRPPNWQPNFTMTATDPQSRQQTAYVFDCVPHAEHEQRVVITRNPVQTGASISDNAYVVPPTVSIEIKMSDSMQSFTLGQWSGAPSRSVSCYQTLVAIQAALLPVQVATRLRSYSNMMITSIRAIEDPQTKYAGNFNVTFSSIITASVTQIASTSGASGNSNSAIPQSTGSTTTGQVQTQPVPNSIQTQNNIASTSVTDDGG